MIYLKQIKTLQIISVVSENSMQYLLTCWFFQRRNEHQICFLLWKQNSTSCGKTNLVTWNLRMEQRINTIEIELQPEDEQNLDCKIAEGETISQATRSSTRPSTSKDAVENDDLLCFFCGKGKPQNLRRASTFKLNKKVREYAVTLQDFDLLAKLSEGDMIVQDAMYHPLCLLAFYKNQSL